MRMLHPKPRKVRRSLGCQWNCRSQGGHSVRSLLSRAIPVKRPRSRLFFLPLEFFYFFCFPIRLFIYLFVFFFKTETYRHEEIGLTVTQGGYVNGRSSRLFTLRTTFNQCESPRPGTEPFRSSPDLTTSEYYPAIRQSDPGERERKSWRPIPPPPPPPSSPSPVAPGQASCVNLKI